MHHLPWVLIWSCCFFHMVLQFFNQRFLVSSEMRREYNERLYNLTRKSDANYLRGTFRSGCLNDYQHIFLYVLWLLTHLSPDRIRTTNHSCLCHCIVLYQCAFYLKRTNTIPENVELCYVFRILQESCYDHLHKRSLFTTFSESNSVSIQGPFDL